MANTIKLKRGSGSDPGASDLAVGEIAIRTDEGKIFTKKDDGSVAEISGSGGGGTDFKYLALRNANNNGAASYPASDFTLVTSGTTTAYTPTAANALLVSYGGVIQQPNTGTSTPTTGFALSGSTIKFGSNVAAAPDFIIYQKGAGIGTPSDDTVDLAQLAHATQGDVLYWGASGAPARLAADNGKFLRSNGNSSNPSWETVTSTPEGTAILSTGESGGSKYLREDGDGTCSWQSVSTTDSTKMPLAGGTFTGDVIFSGTGTDITFDQSTDDLIFNDGAKAVFGTSSDGIAIYHTGSHSFIEDAGTGSLYIDTNQLYLRNNDTENVLLYTTSGGEVRINHNGNTKIKTVSAGVEVTGSQTTTLAVQAQGFECPATVSANWTIGANNNAVFPGPMTVASGVTVTVPANRTLTIV
jgi:hypothetical protein